jgi:hypothetical protein
MFSSPEFIHFDFLSKFEIRNVGIRNSTENASPILVGHLQVVEVPVQVVDARVGAKAVEGHLQVRPRAQGHRLQRQPSSGTISIRN